MRPYFSIVSVLMVFLLFSVNYNGYSQNNHLKSGDKAPLFIAKNSNGETIDLEKVVGKKNLVIYFYPKDDTPGCTTEACSFRDNLHILEDTNTEVLGVSIDDVNSHKGFEKKYNLNFNLISDEDNKIVAAYGVKRDYAGKVYARRVTFLIDKTGTIRYIWDPVKVKGHVEDVIKKIEELDLN